MHNKALDRDPQHAASATEGKARAFLPPDGMMERLIRAHDWSDSPLGAPESWPPALKSAVAMMLPAAHPIVLFWGEDYRALYNDAYASTIGDKHPGALGRPAREFWSELWEDLEPLLDQVRLYGETVADHDREFYVERHDGQPETVLFDLSYSPVHDETDAIAGVLCIVKETTQRVKTEVILRQNEARLAASEEKYRRLFETMSYGFYLAELIEDTPSGRVDLRYLEVNRVFEAMTGLENVAGRRASELVPNVEAYWLKAHEHVVQTGESTQIEQYNGDTQRWYRASLSPLGDAASHRIAVVLEEITERKRIECALRDSEAYYRALARANSNVIYRMSADWREMYELEGQGFLADTDAADPDWMDKYIHPADRKPVRETIDDAIRDKRIFELEHRVLQADGSPGWVASRAIPMLDAEGHIIEWLGTASDITEQKRRESNLELLEDITDDLSSLATEAQMLQAIGEKVAAHFGLDFFLFVDVDEEHNLAIVSHCWNAEAFAPIRGAYRWKDFLTAEFDRAARAGQTVIVEDTASDPRTNFEAFAALNFRAFLAVPIHQDGAWRFLVDGFQASPRHWREDEIELMHEVASRVALRVQRARAEVALRASEEKYRTLFQTMGQGYCELELVRNAEGHVVDRRHIDCNPAFEQLFTSPADESGERTEREPLPALDRWWTEAFERIATQGEPKRIEHEFVARGRWLEAYVYPRGEDRLVILYEEITERKRREVRDRFLLKLSDRLRSESDAEAIGTIATAMLAEHLGVDRCHIARLSREEDRLELGPEYRHADLPLLFGASGEAPLSRFPTCIQQLETEPLVIADVASEPIFSSRERESLLALKGMAAFLVAPLRSGERNVVWMLAVGSATPRQWARADCRLVENVAERTWAAMERARTARHRQLLINELNHRVKNTLMTVQSFSVHTLDNIAAQAFSERLRGLAATHDLLTRSEWQSVSLHDLVAAELTHYGQERFSVDVANPLLPSKRALALGMALHELATNAAKYGALSSPTGGIRIACAPDGEATNRFLFEWTETGGPEVAKPGRRGFGTRLLETGLAYEMDSQVKLDYAPSGLVCTIGIPLPAGPQGEKISTM
jgi:two-component sensor histidine kinase